MTLTSPHEARFSPLTEIVRRRLLPVPGQVVVHNGDRVQADDIVAQATIEGQLHTVDLANALNVSVRTASRHAHVSVGQKVTPETILASISTLGIGKRQIKSPFEGVVKDISEGYIFIRQEPQAVSLRAYVPGRIVECYPHRGVAIRATGALIHGIWGSGGERQGVLVTMVSRPTEALTWKQVGLRYRGTILVGGVLEDPRVLFRAKQFHIHGIIVGSMLPHLRPLCEKLSLPVVVTEGMGRIHMASPILELLRSHHGRLAVISGAQGDGSSGPEVIIPLPAENARESSLVGAHAIKVGTRVRLTRSPYLGTIAQVVTPSVTRKTVAGTQAEGAEVRLQNGRRLFIPLVNMESID